MTAVAPPLTFQPSTRIGWTSNTSNSFGAMNSDDVSRMFSSSGPRKSVQRQNSSSSIASTSSNSSTSTITATSVQTNGAAAGAASEAGSWATRKRPSKGLWPPGKAEPATGISTARPQTVNSATSGPSASSGLSAIHAPLIPSQQMANGAAQQTNGVRAQGQPEQPPAILHLFPMNNTFERKTITVPYYPDVLRIGRQTNQKTIPTPLNGYFDSKVLSRQHAEVYADRQTGRIFIRDVKSSNGTFVNGMRLSQENKESEPRELREQDVLELGIDIVSEDQKTVVHHKVAAKVEHAGIYGSGNDALNFSDLDPNSTGALLGGAGQLRRTGSSGSLSSRGSLGSQSSAAVNMLNQPGHMRHWLNPINMDSIVRKLNAEMKLALQQSNDLKRAKQSIDAMLSGNPSDPKPTESSPTKDPASNSKSNSEKSRPSPSKSKTDLKTHFSEPPAPPPSAPLPEKPDVARALADPVIQPLLRRNDTARPPVENSSPTKIDHSSDILRLCEELKLAKGELSSQGERMKTLESELAQERHARESAEERAQRAERRDSPRDSVDAGFSSESSSVASSAGSSAGEGVKERDMAYEAHGAYQPPPDLQAQLERLRSSMDEMKAQLEAYRSRAEAAEQERDDVRKSLAELIEEKRKANAEASTFRPPTQATAEGAKPRGLFADTDSPTTDANGQPVSPTTSSPVSPTSSSLLAHAGVKEGEVITPEQAKVITQVLAREVLDPQGETGGGLTIEGGKRDGILYYHGRPIASAAAVVLVGVVLMSWMNGWGMKVDR